MSIAWPCSSRVSVRSAPSETNWSFTRSTTQSTSACCAMETAAGICDVELVPSPAGVPPLVTNLLLKELQFWWKIL